MSFLLSSEILLPDLTISVTRQVYYKQQQLLTLREHMGSLPVAVGVRVAQVFSFLGCVFLFVCLRPATDMPSVVEVSALPILDCPFGFL